MKRIDTSIITQDLLDIRNHQLVVLSTYFSTKKDPQRDFFQEKNDYNYIKNWYESVVKNNLVAFVFHDGLSEKFVSEHQNLSVRFIKCTLGSFSLNDERFFIYNEFLDILSDDVFVLATDINDVVVNKSPLSILKRAPEKIFVGCGNIMEWRYSFWTLFKMRELNSKLDRKVPSDILFFPVFNAGLIAGKSSILQILFSKMTCLLDQISDEGNYNMPVLNYVLYRDYFVRRIWYFKWLSFPIVWHYCFLEYWILKRFGILRYIRKVEIDTAGDGIYESSLVYSGFPFNSMFKKYEQKESSFSFLIHK